MEILKPNVGKSMEDIISERKKQSHLPVQMYTLIKSVLDEFKYDGKHTADITRYILDSNVDMALEDCVPMKVFFGMCGNKFEQKEDAAAEKLKIILESGLTDQKQKITVQKGRIKNSKEYKKAIALKLTYSKLKKDCRTLEYAMEMRMEIARTRSANHRQAMSPSAYLNKPM